MISSLCWVPRGAAKPMPKQADPTEEELAAMREHASRLAADVGTLDGNGSESEPSDDEDDDGDAEMLSEGEDGDGQTEAEREAAEVARARAIAASLGREKKCNAKKADVDDELAELDMDKYDEEDDNGSVNLFGNGGLGNVYAGPDEYITLKGDDVDEDEEIEDFTVRASDLLFLASRNEDDVSHIEVWVYDDSDDAEAAGNMYVHHDIMLSAFPLCLAWLDLHPTKHGTVPKSNLVAVGTMTPEIEIWDLDVLDDVEPVASLGGSVEGRSSSSSSAQETAVVTDNGGGPRREGGESRRRNRSKRAPALKEGSHTDAVLGLSWNYELRNVLASGSADNTVKVWDITTQKCDTTLSHHCGKVQAVSWNPAQSSVLLTGSFDKTAALVDMRSGNHSPITWSLTADVECIAWNPHSPLQFIVSTEDGLLKCFDVRTVQTTGGNPQQPQLGGAGMPLYTLSAHDKPACSVSFNPIAPNLLATASTDKMVKLWDVSDHRPNCLASTDLKVGAVFSAVFCKDNPSLLVAGGAKGNAVVWDVMNATPVANKFGSLLTSRRGSGPGLEQKGS
ncbi:hypothetical protein CBR_g8571 [Chara braunii]|uniref:Uncharacterized protein n=1 Tax=Chara braunii TaxID=69332 RepID=A0A388JRZ8_CHABU|nr:hypothetical protein CBR_g8571 [Chara braunii]|eukprot:GBG60547.1 hypothetical protein CBR_g8571 [Chara braunii]